MQSLIKNGPKKWQTIFFLCLLLSCFLLFGSLPRFTAPFLVAYALALTFRPILPRLTRLGLGESLQAGLVLIILGILFIFPLVTFFPAIKQEAENFQFYIPKFETFTLDLYRSLKIKLEHRLGIGIEEDLPVKELLDYARDSSTGILLKTPNLLASVVEWLILVPFFLFFLVRDGKNFRRFFLGLVPNHLFERTHHLLYKFQKNLGNYLFAKFIEASIITFITTFGLVFLQVRFALILGILAGITNIVPYLGPFLGAIPAIVFCLIEYGTGPTLGAVIILYLVANIIDMAIVFPILVSKIVDLHPIIVVVSVIIGSQALGIIGMVISIPCAAMVKLLFFEFYSLTRPVANNHNQTNWPC